MSHLTKPILLSFGIKSLTSIKKLNLEVDKTKHKKEESRWGVAIKRHQVRELEKLPTPKELRKNKIGLYTW
jgi:hypothetical protein